MRSAAPYEPPLGDIQGALRFVAGNEIGNDTVVSDVLEQFGRLAANVIAPSDVAGDIHGARLEADGSVSLPAELEKAHRAVVDGGWAAVPQPPEIGGGGLGALIGMALQEMYASANLALSLNAALTQSAVDLLRAWGTDQQRATYLRMLVSGEWSGTMALTEPEAGSDVGALRTRATKDADGRWRISGTKIFITWGEHDLADNIVNFVLARTPEAPAGTKGISLFLVPKILPGAERNAVRCVGLENKLGIHGSPTCTMQFDGAVGELVGHEHGGLQAMFTMMNAARLAIGVQGLAVGERSWRQAAAYALERRQGRTTGSPPGEQVPIAAHPDVRRMLTDLRASTRAMRLLLYTTADHVEAASASKDPDGQRTSKRFGDLLTPVAKAWCTDEGFRLASVAVQVHGGAGYVEETGIAQRLRDARIGPIYEGTNGIQAIDLLARKVTADGGRTVSDLLQDLWLRINPGTSAHHQSDVRSAVAEGLGAVREATAHLVDCWEASPDDALTGATPYLELLGTVTAGALLAACAIETGESQILEDARYFASHRLRPATGLVQSIAAGSETIASFV